MAPAAAEDSGLRILVASRWYPGFDDPGRGSFVADQAAAVRASGHDVIAVSWERAVRASEDRSASFGPTPGRWLAAIEAGVPLVAPRSWGGPGVPVARIPAVSVERDGRPEDPLAPVVAEAETLGAFVGWLHPRWPIDVIHAHTGVPDGLAAKRVANSLGLPLVVTEHDSRIERLLEDTVIRDAYRELVDRATVVAVSSSLRDRMARALDVDPARIGVIPNVVEIATFEAAVTVERDPHELLYVGSRKASKGVDVLLEAFARLAADDPALHLRMIGRAPSEAEETRLRALADELHIGGRVSFDAPSKRADVAAAMARAAVFVHPSPSETFGVVAAEALAAGLPVAAMRSGGVDEIVGRSGRFGTIAMGSDSVALAFAVRDVLDRRDQFDAGDLRSAVAGYAPDAVAAQLVALYRTVAHAIAASAEVITPPLATALSSDDVPPLIVGLRRTLAARRLARVPAELAASLVVVTQAERPGASRPVSLPASARWVEVDPEQAFREARSRLGGPLPRNGLPIRILRAVLHPVRAIRLRGLAARRADLSERAIRNAVLSGVESVASASRLSDDDQPVSILALDADDVLRLALALPSTRIAGAMTLGGLVDRWDAAGRPTLASGPETMATRGAPHDPSR